MSYHIRTKQDYEKNYLHSVERKNQFWEEIAKEFTWFQPWEKLMDCSMKEAKFNWFQGAKTNISFNCIEMKLKTENREDQILYQINLDYNQGARLKYIVSKK